MGDYNKNSFRERWLRGDLDNKEPVKKKDKNLDEFEEEKNAINI